MQLPIHRWYRFPAGFSAKWVKEVISDFRDPEITLFDPFVGCGTTVLAGEECGVEAIGIDAHPFLVRIAKAKLAWRSDIRHFQKTASEILKLAKGLPNIDLAYPKLIQKCYSEDILHELDKLRRAWLYFQDESAQTELTWLALAGILRPSSHAGTAPWQYVLPKKKKRHVAQPFEAFSNQVEMMIKDITYLQWSCIGSPPGHIRRDDARDCSTIEDDSIDLIITSPPYTNNYDYADVTRLEMSFFGEVHKWADLHQKVRRYLIRSCSQHMSNSQKLAVILEDKRLEPIIDELREVCYSLEREREYHGGRKKYHLMVAAYFSDLAKVWVSLRRVCKEGSKVCFVLGDSAPYGIYVPVDRWLGELAISAGFKSFRFEKTRDRNVKWKSNRKHKIPLHEGRLWVDG